MKLTAHLRGPRLIGTFVMRTKKVIVLRTLSSRARFLGALRIATLGISVDCAGSVVEESPPKEMTPLPSGPRVDPNTVDVEPTIVSMEAPHYPDDSREAGEQGEVLMDALVNEFGQVADVRVTRGVSPGLDESAVAAVRTALFKPALLGGKPVSVWVRDFPIPLEAVC